MDYDLFDTESGNAVVIALDHGLGMGALEGFEDAGATLDAVLAGDPDGVLVGPHFARRYADRFDASDADLLVTADVATFSTRPGHDEAMDIWTQPFDVDSLLELDPSASRPSSSSAARTANCSRRTSRPSPTSRRNSVAPASRSSSNQWAGAAAFQSPWRPTWRTSPTPAASPGRLVRIS